MSSQETNNNNRNAGPATRAGTRANRQPSQGDSLDPNDVARRQADSDEEVAPHTEDSKETELGLLREQNRRLLDELAKQRKDQDDLTTKIEQLIDARSVKEPKACKTQRDPFSGLQDLADQYDSDDSDNEPDGRYRNQRFAERDIYTPMRELRSESGTSLRKILARSLAVEVVVVGTNLTRLVNRSVITSIELNPPEFGSSST